ncbi:MAG: sigma-70 family RNA polymerase sigma factor [Eubacteriales bacterium]|nr:sigma-70 family RNA polymerase sigma factor [Eubacteriales bacterium]
MCDEEIIRLYLDRNELAISATSRQYGSYCTAIARNILGNREDAEECVNDTYLNNWNSIPPHRPAMLSTYLGKITRNLSFNRYRQSRAEKRGGGQMPLILSELDECVSGQTDVEQLYQQKALIAEIDRFLEGLEPGKRQLFVRRYWYAQGVRTIARDLGMTENNVSVQLSRMRQQLKSYLKERQWIL